MDSSCATLTTQLQSKSKRKAWTIKFNTNWSIKVVGTIAAEIIQASCVLYFLFHQMAVDIMIEELGNTEYKEMF